MPRPCRPQHRSSAQFVAPGALRDVVPDDDHDEAELVSLPSHRCLASLLGAFGSGYFWSVITATYLLLRRDVDGTGMDQVVLSELPGENA